MRYILLFIIVSLINISCSLLPDKKQQTDTFPKSDSTLTTDSIVTTGINYADTSDPLYIHTGVVRPEEIVAYAQTFIGTPYVYASADPAVGFDCSGFITYVFNHFNITVPRSSAGFTNVPHEVPVADAKPGDLILFTGTDSTIRIVGHMGIVVQNQNNELLFIHSSSGKANSVTITPLNDYYKGRFVKVIRIFPQNWR
jgi:cell wall-associated NlpC family hydrolase